MPATKPPYAAPRACCRGSFVHAVCLAAALILASACIRRAPAPEPHQWQLRAVVVAVRGTTLELRHKTGQKVTLVLDEQTTYAHGREAAGIELLLPGTRVMVDVESSAGVQRARHVRIFGRPSKRAGPE